MSRPDDPADLRVAILDLFGGGPAAAFDAPISVSDVTPLEDVPDWGAQTLTFATDEGTQASASWLRPLDDGAPPGPAVVYCHAHGGRPDIGRTELLKGRPSLHAPYAADLARRGWRALCLEAPCFGDRAGVSESAEAKARLWRGQTLIGRGVAEQRSAVGWLAAQPDVDADRIAALGISMGGTIAWMLAALDQRVCAAAHLCSLADVEAMIKTGAHDDYDPCLMAPGLLTLARMGEIAGLIAPRPQLGCAGLKDWATPEAAFKIARRDVEAAYRAAGAGERLRWLISSDTGHFETADMRAAVLAFLEEAVAGGVSD